MPGPTRISETVCVIDHLLCLISPFPFFFVLFVNADFLFFIFLASLIFPVRVRLFSGLLLMFFVSSKFIFPVCLLSSLFSTLSYRVYFLSKVAFIHENYFPRDTHLCPSFDVSNIFVIGNFKCAQKNRIASDYARVKGHQEIVDLLTAA